MSLHRFPRLVGGLNSLTDPLVGNQSFVAGLEDAVLQHGLPEQRFGHRILDIEPSHISDATGNNKSAVALTFDPASDQYAATGFPRLLGPRWTIRAELAFAFTENTVLGDHTILRISGTTHDPVHIRAVGDGTNIQVTAVIKDSAGNSVTLTSANRSVAAWTAASSGRFIRLTRDGATVSLHIGETLEDTDTGFTANAHETGVTIFIAATSGLVEHAKIQAVGSVVVANRLLDEFESYWGLNWPTDDLAETDVLGNWPFVDQAASQTEDLGFYATPMNLFNSPAWSGANHRLARGLGMHTHRRTDGALYHILASTRRSTSSTGAAPSGAIYAWLAAKSFLPFYFGGDPANDDATAAADGFNDFARWQFLSILDDCFMGNGKDYNRNFGGSTPAVRYWGITAPATAPYVTVTGAAGFLSTGTYLYCYSYYSSLTGVESGRSPIFSVAASSTNTATVNLFASLDPQVTHIRVYRTQVGGQRFTLCAQGEVATGTAAALSDGSADADILGNTPLPGDDEARSGALKRLYLQGGPGSGMTVVIAAGGSVDNGTHHYAYSWYDPATGDETGMWPATLSGGAFLQPVTAGGGNNTVTITGMVLPDQNSRYTQTRIYRTKANARVWYLLTTITAAATHSDTAADSTLTVDLKERALPPKARMAVLFSNRLITAGDERNPSSISVSVAGDYHNIPWTGHDFAPNPGSDVTGLGVRGRVLLIHYRDGRTIQVPPLGTDADLPLALVIGPSEFSPHGAAVAHNSIRQTPLGPMWLGRDGFYRATEGGAQLVSQSLTPEFLDLNLVRARQAHAVYLADEQLYLCWASRGNERLNHQAFVADLSGPINGTGPLTWGIWNLNADVAGVLTDANETAHYCAMVENGVLIEFDPSSSSDGDGSGTLEGTVSSPGINRFAAISNRTAPTGGDGGYSIHLVKSDGTTLRRTHLDPALAINAPNFYPSASGITSGSWTVYYHGIRFTIETMKADCGNPRPDKTFQSAFITHGKEAAGTIGVEYGVDDTALTSVNANPSATDQMTSQASIQKAGRFVRLRIRHQPPKANEHLKIVEAAVEFSVAGDTRSS